MTPDLAWMTTRLALQTVELAMTAPLVIGYRLSRMTLAGPSPSAADRREFLLMGTEKVVAFGEAWSAALAQSIRANQELWLVLMQVWLSPGWPGRPGATSAANRANAAALNVLAKGMTPIHRRAAANARRLSRSNRK